MPRVPPDHRRGMSLVELLVVIAILGLLAVTVLPNVANTGDSRKVREAARQVSSFIAGAQSRAIGSRGGAGIWIDALPNVIPGGEGQPHVVALDLAIAHVPDPYAGETENAKVESTGGDNFYCDLGFLPQESFLLPSTLQGSANLTIRFAGAPGSFLLRQVGSGWQAQRATSRNQTAANAPWPVGPVAYEVILPATRSATAMLTLADGVVIDLSYTELSPSTTAPLQLLYDTAGSPSTVVVNNADGMPVLEPIYLLVTSLKAIQEGTCFTQPGSYWVAIDPRGGIPRVAEVCPPSPKPAGPWAPATVEQRHFTQQFIRKQPLLTGR